MLDSYSILPDDARLSANIQILNLNNNLFNSVYFELFSLYSNDEPFKVMNVNPYENEFCLESFNGEVYYFLNIKFDIKYKGEVTSISDASNLINIRCFRSKLITFPPIDDWFI